MHLKDLWGIYGVNELINLLYMQCGESPLMAACYDGHLKIVELLIKARANVNYQSVNVPLVITL